MQAGAIAQVDNDKGLIVSWAECLHGQPIVCEQWVVLHVPFKSLKTQAWSMGCDLIQSGLPP